MQLKNLYIGYILISTLLLATAVRADLAVAPMLIKMEADQKTDQDFEFNLYGKSNTEVELSIEVVQQTENGYVGFSSAEGRGTTADWVKLQKSNYQVRDGETTVVKGTVHIPSGVAGSHLVAIIVREVNRSEQLSRPNTGGIQVNVRYAVVINMNITGRGRVTAVRGELGNLINYEENGKLFIAADFISHADTDYVLNSEVQIRDEDNKLVERLQLKSLAAWENNEAGSVIFPESKVRIYAEISTPVKSGTYNLIIRNRLGARTQPVIRQTLNIEPSLVIDPEELNQYGQLTSVDREDAAVQIDQQPLEITVRPDGSSFTTFTLTNPTSSNVTIKLPADDAAPDSTGSDMYEFFPPVVALASGKKARIVLRHTHLPEIKNTESEFIANIEPQNGSSYPLVIKTKILPEGSSL